MAKFSYIGEPSGGRNPMTATLLIRSDVDVEKGTPLYHNNRKLAFSPTPGDSFLGVAAENYVVNSDEFELNPNAGSGKIDVIVSRDSVFRADTSAVVTSTGNIDKNIGLFDINCNGTCPPGLRFSKFILIEKDSQSTNPNEIGAVHTLMNYILNVNTHAFMFDNDIFCNAGDKYLVIPNYGFENMSYDSNGDFVIDLATKGNVKVVGSDVQKKTIDIQFI